MADLKQIAQFVMEGKAEDVRKLVQEALDDGRGAQTILNEGLISGMSVVGIKFKNNEFYIPEVLVAARAMKVGMEVLQPHFFKDPVKRKGVVVLGTVRGDLHDIGKNLVGLMLEGAGFEVIDLGIDVPPEKFIQVAEDRQAGIIALSALLTTTMASMKDVIKILRGSKIGDKAKIIIGGAPVTQAYADGIGADGFSADAASAVDKVRGLLGLS